MRFVAKSFGVRLCFFCPNKEDFIVSPRCLFSRGALFLSRFSRGRSSQRGLCVVSLASFPDQTGAPRDGRSRRSRRLILSSSERCDATEAARRRLFDSADAPLGAFLPVSLSLSPRARFQSHEYLPKVFPTSSRSRLREDQQTKVVPRAPNRADSSSAPTTRRSSCGRCSTMRSRRV